MTYDFLNVKQARVITGHNSDDAFTMWVRRFNAEYPGSPILKVGHRYDKYSIERAILRLNGLEAAQ